MDVAETYRIAQKILRKSGGSRNPEIICECLGIDLEDQFDLVHLKGMYSSANRHRTIFLNSRLYGFLRRFVLMHEIAHDQIPEHRKRARNSPYRELQFFGGKDTSEREANAVAAHVLIDDDLMIELIQEGHTLQHIACAMEVPEDLVLIEIEDYSKLHPDFIVNLPRGSRGNYLKDYDDGTFDCCGCTAEE